MPEEKEAYSDAGTKALNQEDNLATALCKAQPEFKTLEKSVTVKVTMKAGGQYSYKYATLDALRDACDHALSKYGLVVYSQTEFMEDRLILTTTLEHATTGETRESKWYLGEITQDEKDIAARMTYGMRYLYGALVGKVAQEDTDVQGRTREEKGQPKKTKAPLDILKGEYFAFLEEHECFSDDDKRHKWQEIATGKVSTTMWTVVDYRKAILLLKWRHAVGPDSDALLEYLNKAKKKKGMTKTFLSIMDVKKVTELADIKNWQAAMDAAEVGFEQKVNTVDMGKAFMRASKHDGLLDTYLEVVEVDKLSKLDVEDVTDWKNMLATAILAWNEKKDQDISPKLIVEGISDDET